MTFVQDLALVLAVLILLETVVLLVVPGSLLSLAKGMAEYRSLLMALYLVFGGIILYFLLRTYSLTEVLGVGFVVALFYGVILMPYYDTIVDEFATDYETGDLWKKITPGLLLWIALAIGVIVEWSLSQPVF
jgi:hypothetical protein